MLLAPLPSGPRDVSVKVLYPAVSECFRPLRFATPKIGANNHRVYMALAEPFLHRTSKPCKGKAKEKVKKSHQQAGPEIIESFGGKAIVCAGQFHHRQCRDERGILEERNEIVRERRQDETDSLRHDYQAEGVYPRQAECVGRVPLARRYGEQALLDRFLPQMPRSSGRDQARWRRTAKVEVRYLEVRKR